MLSITGRASIPYRNTAQCTSARYGVLLWPVYKGGRQKSRHIRENLPQALRPPPPTTGPTLFPLREQKKS